MVRSDTSRKRNHGQPIKWWTVVLVGWHQNSWHIWNITVFISFSFSSSSQSSVSRLWRLCTHNDYYLFICFHIVVGCWLRLLCTRAQEFSMCASITHNSNKFSPYLFCYSPSSSSSASFHFVRLSFSFPKNCKTSVKLTRHSAKWKTINDSDIFAGAILLPPATTTSVVDVILIQLRSKIYWANTAKLRTDWRIIQYYSLQRKQKKTKRKPKSFPFFLCCILLLGSFLFFAVD